MVNIMPAKVCTACNLSKPLTEFHVDRSKADGRRFVCKACANAAEREHYEEHRDTILKKLAGRPNREVLNARQREYRARNREAINARARAKRQAVKGGGNDSATS
jgi:hypothetical protein